MKLTAIAEAIASAVQRPDFVVRDITIAATGTRFAAKPLKRSSRIFVAKPKALTTKNLRTVTAQIRVSLIWKELDPMPKLLLIEDDLEFALVMKEALTRNHYVVEHVSNGADAYDRLFNYSYDIVVMDWQLPDAEGPEICHKARKKGVEVPILMLTGMNTKQSKITGLDEGADDYLTKPCDMDELLAHLRALVRRQGKTKSNELQVGCLRLDAASHKAYLREEEISLSKTEFALLDFLMRHQGQVFDADALLNRVWSSESEVSKDLVKVYINKLRQKLKIEGEPPMIVTVHGVGYRMDCR